MTITRFQYPADTVKECPARGEILVPLGAVGFVLMGTLLEVGSGKRAADSIPGLIASGSRRQAGELAGLKDPKILTRKKEGLRELIFSFGSGMESKNLSKQLQSVSTPRVSYLWAY